jgi:ABC-2 type transport system permease protein
VSTSEGALQPIDQHLWLNGFLNLARKEVHASFGSRLWAIHTLVWLLVINGLVGLVLLVSTRLDPASSGPVGPTNLGVQIFMTLAGIAVAMGIGIVGQSAIIGEIQTGTAAWVLTKPASRSAFVLARSAGVALQIVVFGLLAQAVVAFALISAFTGVPPTLGGFAAGVALLILHSVFYVALAVMLGTIFSTQAPIVGVVIGVIFAQGLLASFVAPLASFLPYTLMLVATSIATGEPLGTAIPIWTTLALTIAALVIAVRRFSRADF